MRCLDTDFLVAVLRGEPNVKKIVDEFDKPKDLATTTITAFELYYGAERSAKRFENSLAVTSILNGLAILDFDLETARKAAQLQAALVSKGKDIGIKDIFIAAACIRNDCSLLTLNKKHFSMVPGLRLD